MKRSTWSTTLGKKGGSRSTYVRNLLYPGEPDHWRDHGIVRLHNKIDLRKQVCLSENDNVRLHNKIDKTVCSSENDNVRLHNKIGKTEKNEKCVSENVNVRLHNNK